MMARPRNRAILDIRLDSLHREALENLQELNGEKTAVKVVRSLIRNAAVDAGVWPQDEPVADIPALETA